MIHLVEMGMSVKWFLLLVYSFREGILYSLRDEDISGQKEKEEPPTNLQFLDVLNEFTFRLIAQDKAGKTGV